MGDASLLQGSSAAIYSLLGWLFGRRQILVEANLPGPGLFAIDVVGELQYRHAIEIAAGGRTEEGCNEIVEATLILEDSNPHDDQALQVNILSRENARNYRRELAAAGHPEVTARCEAKIVGGRDRGPDDRGYFGVKLDLPPACDSRE